MVNATFAVLMKLVHALGPFLVQTWPTLRNSFFTRYHPEQHYMRGRGPKWREKHSGAPVT